MNEAELQALRDKAIKAAETARDKIKVLSGKANNVRKEARLIPPGTPAMLRDALARRRNHYLQQMKATERAAKREIDNILKKAPPELQAAMQQKAYDVLTDRANVTRARLITTLKAHHPLMQDTIDKVRATAYDRPSTDRQPPKPGHEDPHGGTGRPGSTPPNHHPADPPGGKSATRPTPERSSKAHFRLRSKFFSQPDPKPQTTEPDKTTPPKRFSRSDVSIYASPKAEAPDKTRTPEITKDATPKPVERFNKHKESKFLSPEHQAFLNKAHAKTWGPGRDER